MIKPLRNFRNFSTIDKAKIVVFFIPLVVLALVDLVTEAISHIAEFLEEYWRPVIGAIAVVFILVLLGTWIYDTEYGVPDYKGYYWNQENFVYAHCHEVANNFIVAEDGRVRGFDTPSEKNIDKLIAYTHKFNMKDADKLTKWLVEIENGDYSNTVEFHNYCWKKLNGKIGWAVDLKKKYKN